MLKKQIRNKYINMRNNFSNIYIDNVSKSISHKLFNLPMYKNCETIFLYLSLEKEISTKYIIEKAKQDNKQIYCPVLTHNKREMTFKKYNNSLLIKNKFNILEPLYQKSKSSDEKTIIITPAIVYNKNKYRIGYGGGYYDNFLQNNIYLSTIGLCFDKFIIDFKEDYYDKKVDIIITEKRVLI